MNEKFEYEGRWWLPDRPEKQIRGTLKFDQEEGGILNLEEPFQGFQEEAGERIIELKSELIKAEIILGILTSSELITLYSCESYWSFPPTFYVDSILIGAHFQKPIEIKFTRTSIYYTYLDQWCNPSYLYFLPESARVISKLIEANINDELKISITGLYFSANKSNSQQETNLKNKVTINVESPTEKSLNEYRKIIRQIQNFLSFGVTKPAYPMEIIGKAGNGKSVKMLYKGIRTLKISKILQPYDMLFTLRDICDDFEKYLRNWFTKIQMLKLAYDFYFSTLYATSMYLTYEFLSIVFALEAYHRAMHCGVYLTKKDYKPLYKIFIKSIPKEIESVGKKISINPDFERSLKEKLNYMYEFPFRKRLEEILEKCGDVADFLIHNKEEFIKDVKDTRNRLVHPEVESEHRRKKGVDLDILFQKTEYLLEICFLLELGMSLEKIKTLVSRNQRYKHLAKQKRNMQWIMEVRLRYGK